MSIYRRGCDKKGPDIACSKCGKRGKRGKCGPYWYKFVFDGILYQRSTKQYDREAAKNIEAAFRKNLANAEVGIKEKKPVPTFEAFVPRVMEEIKKNCVDHPRTAEFYDDAFNRALSFQPLAKANLKTINPELLSRFTTKQLTDVRPATVNRSLAAIRRAMYLAYEWELIDRVPKFEMLEGERSREFVLTGALRDEFINGLPEPCRTIARFLVDTGLRISECSALTWDRVFIEDGNSYIYIDKGKSKKAKRHIPLTPDARAILENQKQVSRSNYIFVRFGERVDKELWYKAPVSRHTISNQFSARRDDMGLPWDAVLHSTRHTALTDLGAAGADAFTIQAVAGHASVTTSQRYIHPVPETMSRAIERLDAYRTQDAESRRARLEIVGSRQAVATVSATSAERKFAAAAK